MRSASFCQPERHAAGHEAFAVSACAFELESTLPHADPSVSRKNAARGGTASRAEGSARVRHMEAPTTARYGRRDMTGTLRRVLMRTPQEDVSSWKACGWRAPPDPARLRAEHEDFGTLLED